MRISDWSSDVCSSDPDSPVEHSLHADRASHQFTPQGPRRIERGKTAAAGVHQPRYGCLKRTIKPVRHRHRSEEHTSELQSLMRISYAVFCMQKKNNTFNL